MGYKWNPFIGNFDRVEDTGAPLADIETITGDSGGAVGPDAVQNLDLLGSPDIDVVGIPASNQLQMTNLTKVSKYIVDSVSGTAPYQTIQAALDAIASDGVTGRVIVRPGTYTEDLTFPDQNVTLEGDRGGNVVLAGTHTPSNTHNLALNQLQLQDATDIFNSAGAGVGSIEISGSFITLTNGFVFNLPNWTGTFLFDDCGEASTNDGVVNNTAGVTIKFLNTEMGAGSGQTMTLTGNANVRFDTCNVNCPVNIAGSGTFIFQNGCKFANTVTIGGTKSGTCVNSSFLTGANQALVYNSATTGFFSEVTFDSTNDPAIGGTGTIEFGQVAFLSDENIAGTVTVTYTSVMEAGTAYLQNISFDRGTSTVDTDGELIIGSTGNNPQISTLTPDSGILITNAPGSITIGLDGSAVGKTITGDSGGALSPTLGNWNILGQAGFLTNSGGGSTITTGITTDFETTAMHGWNGSILETADVSAASDGGTITFSVEKSGGGNLTVVFSDGYYDWTTAPDTVSLTAGSDTAPQINYVYLLQSNKTLTAATGGWPATEHAPLATILCESAATFQTKTAIKFHAWTDHLTSTSSQGHVGDLNFWIRQQNATWSSGVVQSYTITVNGGSADNVIFTSTAGIVLQLHMHTFPAFAGTPDVYVINDSVTPYTIVTDLNALLTDSTGASMSGKYFSLVIWGVVSEATGDCKLFVNLPSGSYNNQAGVDADTSSFANFNIPSDFKGTGFLISEWKLRHQAAASGTWTSIEEIDLRGLLPSVAPAGSVATTSEFADNLFRIFDDGDDTKKIAFQASGITTATTRTITMIDADLDLNTVSNSFPTDSGIAAPSANALTLAGGTSAAGTTPVAISGAASTATVSVQTSQALAATDATKIGLCNFDSASFAVDANGFVTSTGGGGGILVQQVRASITSTGSSAVIIPADDTIPQNTEGAEIMTVTITPTNASNILILEHDVNTGEAVEPQLSAAYFVDSTADAIAAFMTELRSGNYGTSAIGKYYLTAGTTNARTYKLRIGTGSGGTIYWNQRAAGRLYGGVGVSTFIVSEIEV